MAGMVKKRPVDSSSTGQANNPKHVVAPRQRGIPTRVSKPVDNRNLRPESQIQHLSSESLQNKVQELNGNLDSVEAKTATISLRTERRSLSGAAASVHKANSLKLVTECDNRSQLTPCELTLVSDVSKPVNRVKASHLLAYNPGKLRSVVKPSTERSSPVCTVHVTESSPNSVRSPKRLPGNKNCFSKNVNKMSSSDETCALKSTEVSRCLNGEASRVISVSVDHIAVGEEHRNGTTVGLLNANEVFVSDSSVISEPAVSGMHSKEISSEKASERSLEQATETKRVLRGRPGIESSGSRSNLRPHSSGGLNTSRNNQKFRQSTSNERTAGNKDSTITRYANRQPVSDSRVVNSTEMEQESNKRRKNSGGSGIKVPPLKDTSGRCEGPNSPKVHAVTRNQNALASGAASKTEKGLKNHVNATVSGLYKASVLPSRKADMRGRSASAKLSSVPKILVSHEPRNLEVVPMNSSQLSSCVITQDNDGVVTLSKSSAVSYTTAEAPSVDKVLGPADNMQAQPMVQNVNGDANEDSSRRLFHAQPHAASTEERPKMGHYVELDEKRSDFRNHHTSTEERRCASESQDVVVLDGERYQQMLDDFKALEMTILQLQRVLIEGSTVESQIGDNEWKPAVKTHCYDGGDEVTASDGQIQLANVCQENIRLQKKVVELEKLLQDREQMIRILRQKSVRDKSQAQHDIKMLPGIESSTSEADVELYHKSSCCATERNVELPASSLSSHLSLTHGCKSIIHLSSNVVSPPGSPRRHRFQHTSPVLHFTRKSKEHCSPTSGNKAFMNNDYEMDYLFNDAGESSFSRDFDKPVVQSSRDDGRQVALSRTNSVDSSQTIEMSPSKRHRKATQGGQEDEDGDYSMFDYNCSVDSDGELGPGICDATESICLKATDAGESGMPFFEAEHCTPARKLTNEESEHRRSTARESRPGATDAGDSASLADIGVADARDNNVRASAQTDQNFNSCFIGNGFCDHLGNFDASFSSNSVVSASCPEQEKNIYNMLHSVECSNQEMSIEDAAFSLPASLDRQTGELCSCGDLKSRKALIEHHPKHESSSIPSLPCNPGSDEAKSLKLIQSSQTSNVTQSKVPNQMRTLLRMPKCHSVVTSSCSSAASAPPSGICSLSKAINVLSSKPDVSDVRQRYPKELTSSKLPSLRFSRIQTLSNPISK